MKMALRAYCTYILCTYYYVIAKLTTHNKFYYIFIIFFFIHKLYLYILQSLTFWAFQFTKKSHHI